MEATQSKSHIQEFFSGKNVFITGSTGFLGSVLLEKILRCCPDVNKIYLLIRGRKGVDPQGRMEKILNSKLFCRLQTENLKDKIELLNGEMTLPGLGLSQEDKNKLIRDVSVVFHVAATTNFGAHLRRAVEVNLQGTEKVLQLAHQMKNLQVLVYVSTAYCNAVVRGMTTEDIYPSWIDSDELMEKLSTMTDVEIEEKTKNFLGGYPTTYSFTKHLSENLLFKKRKHVPVAVVRPSVVLGTMEEPIPGWVENVQNGGVAFIAGAGKGIFRTVLGDNSTISDIVPCDMVASLCVAAAWDVARLGQGNCKVYHCTSGLENPITLKDYCDLTIEKVRQFPCSEVIWYPAAKCRLSILRNYVFVFLFHLMPGYILALWEMWNEKNRPVIQYHKKFIRGMAFIHYFTKRTWYFDTRNTRKLASDLSEEDRDLFSFDVTKIYWPTYLERCVLGVRHFYHGDYPETIEKSRNNIKVLRIVHYAFYCGVFAVAFYLLLACGVDFWSAVLGGASAFAFIFWLSNPTMILLDCRYWRRSLSLAESFLIGRVHLPIAYQLLDQLFFISVKHTTTYTKITHKAYVLWENIRLREM